MSKFMDFFRRGSSGEDPKNNIVKSDEVGATPDQPPAEESDVSQSIHLAIAEAIASARRNYLQKASGLSTAHLRFGINFGEGTNLDTNAPSFSIGGVAYGAKDGELVTVIAGQKGSDKIVLVFKTQPGDDSAILDEWRSQEGEASSSLQRAGVKVSADKAREAIAEVRFINQEIKLFATNVTGAGWVVQTVDGR